MSSTSSVRSGSPVRILLADDHPITCEGLTSLIRQQEGMCVVAAAGNGEDAVTLFRQHQPDVTLLDARMPHMDGLEALQMIRRDYPQARVILLSTFDAQEDIYHALRAGAKSYLLKDTPPAELFHAIEQVAGGKTYLPAHISSLLAQRLRTLELTTRELEIVAHLAAGESNQEIASRLFIAEGTVKAHLINIFKKMDVSDRTQAVTTAIKRGLVHL